jgi:hypothetical protein
MFLPCYWPLSFKGILIGKNIKDEDFRNSTHHRQSGAADLDNRTCRLEKEEEVRK